MNTVNNIAIAKNGEFNGLIQQGTFAPNLVGEIEEGTANYTLQTGYYTLIGKLCILSFNLAGTFSTPPVGTVRISNLPFVSGENYESYNPVVMAYRGSNVVTPYLGVGGSGRTYVNFGYTNTGSINNIGGLTFGSNDNQISDTNFSMYGTFTYKIA